MPIFPPARKALVKNAIIQIMVKFLRRLFPNYLWRASLFTKLFLVFIGMALAMTLMGVAIAAVVFELDLEKNLLYQAVGIIGLITLSLGTLLSYLASRSITHPLTLVMRAIEQVAGGDLGVQIDIKQNDEFGQFAYYFNGMVNKLREARDREAEIIILKSQFVSVTAHQLRTPLTIIKWATHALLSGDAGRLNNKQKGALNRSYTTILDMMSLINQLLDVTKIEEGRFGYRLEAIDLVSLINDTVKGLLLAAKERHLKINFQASHRIYVKADRIYLKLALANLIDNAIRYSYENDVVEISLHGFPEKVQIDIRDHGIGIPPAEQRKVLQKFYRASNATRMQPNGTGLGLYIARNVIQRHGGSLQLTSALNRGTLASVSLPKA